VRTLIVVLVVAVCSALPRAAGAEEPRLELGGGIGYHGAWTTGVDPYRFGVGLGGGRTFRGGLFLGGRVSHHFGESAAGVGPKTVYVAHDSATRFDVVPGFSVTPVRWLLLRPGAILGLDWISGHTQIGHVRLSDDRLVPSFGPYLRLAWQGRGVYVGAEGEGRFVPGQAAAPRAGASLVWGARF